VTVNDLLEIIRIKLADPLQDDPEPDEGCLFKTTELVYYINNALKEAVYRGKLLVKNDFTIDLIAGKAEYTIPDTVINIEKVFSENDNNEPLVKVQEQDLSHGCYGLETWREDEAVYPTRYIQGLVNNGVLFYPKPTIASTLTIRATYLASPVIEGDSLPVELSTLFEADLIFWVLGEAYDKQDADGFDPTASKRNFDRFDEAFGKKVNNDLLLEIQNYPDNPGSLRDY